MLTIGRDFRRNEQALIGFADRRKAPRKQTVRCVETAVVLSRKDRISAWFDQKIEAAARQGGAV
jgi:hypothetical protein